MFNKNNPQYLQRIIMLGILIALQIILSRFSIGQHLIRLDLTFVILFLIGLWYQPVYAGIAEGITDLLSSLVNGSGFFLGFTLSAILSGLISSWLIHKHQVTWKRIIVYQILICLGIDFILNTVWISILLNMSLKALIIPRLIKELISLPVQIIIIHWIGTSKSIHKLTDRYFK